MAGPKPSQTVTVHTAVAQAVSSGYTIGQRVSHGGVVWISLINNNVYAPGHGLGSIWDYWD